MHYYKIIALTGASGNMGRAGLDCLLNSNSNYRIKVLARPSKKNFKLFNKYKKYDRLEVIWGDLTNYDDVMKLVDKADYVLHVGGLVSPEADKFPEQTYKINVGGTENIVKAILSQENSQNIKLVYIGSVAQMGFRKPPNHFGKTGDRLMPAKFDHYAESKIKAERIVAESGLRYWVSLRQSGILYPKLINKGINPITFHVPLQGVLEWCTIEDAGNILLKVCEDTLPDTFWRRFYNISSGASYRLTNYEFMCRILDSIGIPPPEKIFDTKWFALQNFHGHWYTDADVLEDYLQFRNNIHCDDYFKMIKSEVPKYMKFSKFVPAPIIKFFMKYVANNKTLGTQSWIKKNNKQMIDAFYGSYEAWNNIPDWQDMDLSHPSEEYTYLPSCFDESKPIDELDINDMHKVADFYGCKCISENMTKGDMFTPLKWEYPDGRCINASPNLVLFGGHI